MVRKMKNNVLDNNEGRIIVTVSIFTVAAIFIIVIIANIIFGTAITSGSARWEKKQAEITESALSKTEELSLNKPVTFKVNRNHMDTRNWKTFSFTIDKECVANINIKSEGKNGLAYMLYKNDEPFIGMTHRHSLKKEYSVDINRVVYMEPAQYILFVSDANVFDITKKEMSCCVSIDKNFAKEKEKNNDAELANTLNLGKTYVGTIITESKEKYDIDIYKFKVTEQKRVKFVCTTYNAEKYKETERYNNTAPDMYFYLYSDKKMENEITEFMCSTERGKYATDHLCSGGDIYEAVLEPGTYYIKMEHKYGYRAEVFNYTLKVS